jgi:hypothetical protein
MLLVGLAAAAAFALRPLVGDRHDGILAADDLGAANLRHRVALEALRDVETDRRAGSLTDTAYADQQAQAEERAASTRAALDRYHPDLAPTAPTTRGRRAAAVAAGVIGSVLLAGSFIPATGIGNSTSINQVLADAQAAESARQGRIDALRDDLADGPGPETISDLADEYLAGSTQEDLVRAAVSLQLLIELQPERADAFERIMTAYLRAGDATNARAVHSSYTDLETADPIEVAFFDGLIALRGEDDPASAVVAFDRFLELAPDDARAGMIRGLRDEAAGT